MTACGEHLYERRWIDDPAIHPVLIQCSLLLRIALLRASLGSLDQHRRHLLQRSQEGHTMQYFVMVASKLKYCDHSSQSKLAIRQRMTCILEAGIPDGDM